MTMSESLKTTGGLSSFLHDRNAPASKQAKHSPSKLLVTPDQLRSAVDDAVKSAIGKLTKQPMGPPAVPMKPAGPRPSDYVSPNYKGSRPIPGFVPKGVPPRTLGANPPSSSSEEGSKTYGEHKKQVYKRPPIPTQQEFPVLGQKSVPLVKSKPGG